MTTIMNCTCGLSHSHHPDDNCYVLGCPCSTKYNVGPVKYNTDSIVGSRDIIKPRYADIPLEGLREIALVFSQGAEHYGVSNWKNGLDIIDVFNHMDEHLHHWVKMFNEGDEHSCELCNKEYASAPVRELAKVAWGCLVIIWYYYCKRDVYESGRGK